MKTTHDTQLTLATGETVKSDDEGCFMPWYHTIFALIDKNKNEEFPDIIQYVHFICSEETGNTLEAELKTSMCDESFRQTDFSSYNITLEARYILLAWNHVLHCAQNISAQQLEFGKNFKHSASATNCRTGVKALHASLGIPFNRESFKSDAGLEAPDIKGIPVCNWDRKAPPSFTEALAENERLVSTLSPNR